MDKRGTESIATIVSKRIREFRNLENSSVMERLVCYLAVL